MRVESRNQQRIVLARLDGAHRQHVAVAALGQADRGAGRAGPGGRTGEARDPVMDGSDPLGGDRERLHHLVGDELRRGVDPGSVLYGPADELGEAQGRGVAQLRVEHDGQVVHRHHTGRPPGGRDHEVGSVHHVPGADEPLHRGLAGPRPGRVQRPGRHGPLPGRDPGRHQILELAPTAPADGEGRDLDRRFGREPGQGPEAEGAHPGGPAEKGRGLDPDGQPVLVGGSRSLRRHPGSLAHGGTRSAPR